MVPPKGVGTAVEGPLSRRGRRGRIRTLAPATVNQHGPSTPRRQDAACRDKEEGVHARVGKAGPHELTRTSAAAAVHEGRAMAQRTPGLRKARREIAKARRRMDRDWKAFARGDADLNQQDGRGGTTLAGGGPADTRRRTVTCADIAVVVRAAPFIANARVSVEATDAVQARAPIPEDTPGIRGTSRLPVAAQVCEVTRTSAGDGTPGHIKKAHQSTCCGSLTQDRDLRERPG